MNHQYQLSLLCLTHLLISADGIVDENENDAVRLIREREKVTDTVFAEFEQLLHDRKEREVFRISMDLINQCSREEKLRIFVMLYKLSEIDGRVHLGEIRLLLYSIKYAEIDFDEVVECARKTPGLL